MSIRLSLLVAVLWSLSGSAFAVAVGPEIDGALSVQAIALMGGLVYLLKRKK